MLTGYSDRINHALAFAAKHHDQQVRKGTRLPYTTLPANLAIILTRYSQDDSTVAAGILHNVVSDYVIDGLSREHLDQRIGQKFGSDVLETVLEIAERRDDDDGVELSPVERKEDLILRLESASERAHWVCAANRLHTSGTLLADLRRTEFPETVWERQFDEKAQVLRWYRRVHDALHRAGFTAPIMVELSDTIVQLEERGR